MDYAKSLTWKTPGAPWDTPEAPEEVDTIAAPETAVEEPIEPVEQQVPTDGEASDGLDELEEGDIDE